MPEKDIELQDAKGNRVTVTAAYYRRWKTALDVSFRPVAEKKTTPVVVTPAPTGDNTKEN